MVVGEVGYEYCLCVIGMICVWFLVNDKLKIGMVELLVEKVEIFNVVKDLLFVLYENFNEDMWMIYCYFDLCCFEM